VYQLDVKSAYLHGELVEDVYVDQPLSYQKEDKNKVYKLKKALYGLRQAPRAWYNKIEDYFTQELLDKCPHEHTLFVKQIKEGKILIVSLYVDYLIYIGNDEALHENIKSSMSDLGKMRYSLGVEIKQYANGIFIYQQKYAQDILIRFGMETCNRVCKPIVPRKTLFQDEKGRSVNVTEFRQMIGCLIYLLATRPDLSFFCLSSCMIYGEAH